eukprot:gnl/Chilomastix_cuspidata/1066.p1 GENE.gnl/Chilomastix_cuspidata/1066~~gnl/Chilomastix_cuspidata/1066.p1  ORF type:complete len:471 (+),score=92.44 gnl/Chilomastix_cuspidata/1066:61-1413(+)
MLSKALLATTLCAAVLAAFLNTDPEYETAYIGTELSDAFASIHYLGNGIALAGKRSSTYEERIFRSTNYGKPGSWESVGPISGYSGSHTYFFGHHNDIVLAGTGDVGNACLLRSEDAGLTWEVALSTSDLKTFTGGWDPRAVFSPLFFKGRWVVCLKMADAGMHMIESYDEGITWQSIATTGLTAGARRMILTRDEEYILYTGSFADNGEETAFFYSTDAINWTRRLEGEAIFHGVEDLGDCVWLTGTYNYGDADLMIIHAERTAGIATVTTEISHDLVSGDKVAIYNMAYDDLDARPFATVTVMNATAFSYASEGADYDRYVETDGRVQFENPLKIFRTADCGETWVQVARPVVFSSLAYVRMIVDMGEGIVYAFACASESFIDDRGVTYYKSEDYGRTWFQLPNQYTSEFGPLNSIYEVALVPDAPDRIYTMLVAAQPDSEILWARVQ